MARPRKSDHSKQLLLEAGARLLTEHGYHGTGIKRVLDEVGVPKGSFYNFFPSKEAFVADIVYQYGDDVSTEFQQAIAGHEQAPALLRLWYSFHNKVRKREAAGESCACLLGALSAEIAQASPLCNQALADVQRRWTGALESLVRRARLEGHIATDAEDNALAMLIFNCWQGGLLQYQLSGDSDALLTQLKTLMNSLATDSGRQLLGSADIQETP